MLGAAMIRRIMRMRLTMNGTTASRDPKVVVIAPLDFSVSSFVKNGWWTYRKVFVGYDLPRGK